MANNLEIFVSRSRELFDDAEPPMEVWKNITCSMKPMTGKATWIKKIKHFGFSASLLIVAVYVIYLNLKPVDQYTLGDARPKDSTPAAIHGVRKESYTIGAGYVADKTIREETDPQAAQNTRNYSANNASLRDVTKKGNVSGHAVYHYPDAVIDSYNSMTKLPGKFYTTRPHTVVSAVVVLMKNKTPICLTKDSYIIVEFTRNDIVDVPGQAEVMVKAAGLGDADIYVSPDNAEYTYLGLAGRGITEFDLENVCYKNQVRYVKIVGKDFKGKSEGFDLVNVAGLSVD